jgi:TrmH family RNA methyltransferase
MGSISANRIKFIRSLAQKKFRDEHSLFVAEGEKIVTEAQASGYKIEEIYRIEEIGAEAMARISNLSSPSPVLAVIRKPEFRTEEILDNLTPHSRGLYLALDGVKDPGNLGTIIRVADWFGVDAIFASPGTVEVYNPKVVQATMGALARVRVHYINLEEWLQTVKETGLPVYGTLLEGGNMYQDGAIADKSKGVIIMGNEGNGISPAIRKLITHPIRIPSYPADAETSESLNVGIATAIVLAEFRR